MLKVLKFTWVNRQMNRKPRLIVFVVFGIIFLLNPLIIRADDPLKKLVDHFEKGQQKETHKNNTVKKDPLKELIKHFLPFTLEEEESAAKQARKKPRIPTKVGGQLWKKVQPYEKHIREASAEFNVPVGVIASVIMLESGGREDVEKPEGSSAQGLMQIVDGTYAALKKRLESRRIYIKDRYDPHSAILAGTLYLSENFEKARVKHPELDLKRNFIEHWKYPMRYYFAGPDYEKKKLVYVPEKRQVCLNYSGTLVTLKQVTDYSAKGLRWANLIQGVT